MLTKGKIRKLVSPFRSVSNESDQLRSNLVAVQVPPYLQGESRRYWSSAEIASRRVDESLACNVVQTCVSSAPPLTTIPFSFTNARSTLGLSHDLSKRVGASYDVPHGISSVRICQVHVGYV